MLVINKDKVKELSRSMGYGLWYVIEKMGVTRSHFNNMTYMRSVKGQVIPVVKIKEDYLDRLEELFQCNKEDFTDDTNRYNQD